jgi:acyl-CoA thioesterase FadM
VLSLLWRLLMTIVRAWRAPRSAMTDELVLRLRVAPGDLDLNLHMNNGRYLALMDLGRLDLALRGGLFRPAWQGRWRPVLGSATIRFRRSLRPFQRFELRTRLLCWDHRWFVFEQRFEADGELYAVALARGLFTSAQGTVAPAQTLAAVGITTPSPAPPGYVIEWARADADAWAAAATAHQDVDEVRDLDEPSPPGRAPN